MSRVEADYEAIEGLRKQFDRFYYDQKAVIEQAERLIASAIEDLEAAQYRWAKEAERCESELFQCQEEAWHAAQVGGRLDCSEWERGLEEATEALEIINYWLGEVRRTADQYLAAKNAFERWFDWELPRVRRYLDDRVKALRAFLAANI